MAFIICGSWNAFAQENERIPEFITDRPDKTEAPSLVPKGFLQIESGFYYEETERDNVQEKITGYNTTLLRYGLLGNLELRMRADLKRIQPEDDREGGTGLSPLALGAKIGIANGGGILPQVGLLGHVYLPFTAHEVYRPETTGIDFKFAFNHELSEDKDLSYNLGAEWRDDTPEASLVYSIAYGWDFLEQLGFFAELYGKMPENGRADHHWDAGLTWLLRDNLQLDTFVGTGINTPREFLFGGGISYRIPR